MKEIIEKIIEKIIERLEEVHGEINFEKSTKDVNESFYDGMGFAYGYAVEIVNQVTEEYATDNNVGSITETVKHNSIECEVPSDYFQNIKEVHVIDEWTEEKKVFKELEINQSLTNDGWIPISEGLPDKDMECWITADYHGRIEVLEDVYVNGAWLITADGFVVAWQPKCKPKAYQPKGEEK